MYNSISKYKNILTEKLYRLVPRKKGLKIGENPELGLGNIILKEELVKQGHPLENDDMLMAQEVASSFLTADMKKIVNIGAGIGSFEAYAAPKNKDKKFIASEFDEPSVAYSKAHRAHENVEYTSHSIATLKENHGLFDLAVSIDVIEHIKNYKSFLDEFATLADTALIVTPNRDFSLPIRMEKINGVLYPCYKHHVLEFNYGELYYILSMYYSTVKIYAQPNVYKKDIEEVGFYTNYERLFALCKK